VILCAPKSNSDALFLRITNDTKGPSVDTFRMSTLHMLKHFGVPIEGWELKIDSRGSPPLGGG
jgi:RNA 3'-terminal phosphate cyclase-like protein